MSHQLEVVAKAVNKGDDFTEVRFSNEDTQENFVIRPKEGGEYFTQGGTYRVTFTLIEKPPPPPTVIAELPADEAGSLPASAEIKKGRSK